MTLLVCPLDVSIQLISYALCLIVSATPLTDEPASALLSQDSAFFNVFVAVLFLAMLTNPNKPIDLLFCSVPQKYFIFIALWLSHFVLSYDWISIVAVSIVGTSLYFVRHMNLLNKAAEVIEKVITCGKECNCEVLGYITAE